MKRLPTTIESCRMCPYKFIHEYSSVDGLKIGWICSYVDKEDKLHPIDDLNNILDSCLLGDAQDHFAEVSNMGSISADDMKSCAKCKKFIAYALDRNRGICQDNHMEVNTNFRGCVEWVSNTEAKI